jgi:RNase P protein component
VDRNLLKRRLRNILRTEILPGLRLRGDRQDVLVRARREAYGVRHGDLLAELNEWLETRWPLDSS